MDCICGLVYCYHKNSRSQIWCATQKFMYETLFKELAFNPRQPLFNYYFRQKKIPNIIQPSSNTSTID